jgi:Zn-dependent protease with chaperone function
VTFEERLLVVSFAAFAVTCGVVSTLVPSRWRRVDIASPAARAAALLRLRLWPASTATAASLVVAAAFILFEQRQYPESTGVLLPALAVVGGAIWASAIVRAVRLWSATRRLRRGWMASAERIALADAAVPAFAIDAPFPVVAVVGVLRPRLVVARSVVAACTPAELRAIVAHENRHVAAQDNFRRVLIALAPDLIAWLPMSARLRAAWNDAVEEAADDAAARVGADGRVTLAEALVRVARLDLEGSPAALPASALYRGENLDRRVRRLLAPEPVDRGTAPPWWRRAAPIAAWMIAAALALDAIHIGIELAITFLP